MKNILKFLKTIFTILKWIIIVILLLIVLGLIIFGIYMIYDKIRDNRLIQNNAIYIEEYLKNNLQDEIVSIEQKVYIPGFIGGGHYENVEEDNPSRKYCITYTCYDREMQLQYNLSFMHEEHEEIELYQNEKIDYMKNYDIYNSNYELMESVIKKNGGISTNLGYYNKNNLDKYILLIYTPDIEATKEIVKDLYNEVYGGYAYKVNEKTQFINISMPRYIFCNDKELYESMAKNKIELSDYLKDKDYTVKTSKIGDFEEYIDIYKTTEILLEYKTNNFNFRKNEAQMYQLENYVTNEKKWIITYELEIGVNYYLNTYVLSE